MQIISNNVIYSKSCKSLYISYCKQVKGPWTSCWKSSTQSWATGLAKSSGRNWWAVPWCESHRSLGLPWSSPEGKQIHKSRRRVYVIHILIYIYIYIFIYLYIHYCFILQILLNKLIVGEHQQTLGCLLAFDCLSKRGTFPYRKSEDFFLSKDKPRIFTIFIAFKPTPSGFLTHQRNCIWFSCFSAFVTRKTPVKPLSNLSKSQGVRFCASCALHTALLKVSQGLFVFR